MPRFDGADISHYQPDKGPIDWTLLRAASWWFATKATQSIRSVDPTFAEHWGKSFSHGFQYRLAYHWLSSTTDPVQQAIHYLKVVGPFKPGDGAMLDAEERGITVDMVLEWCEAVERVTHRPVAVYSGAYVAGGTIWQSTAVRTSLYGKRPMHLAAYTSEAKALALPGVMAYPWDAWQWSSNGPVPGIVGRCDMNRIDNRAVFDVACGVTAIPDPFPPPNPQPPGEIDTVDIRLLTLTDSDAQFLAETTSDGRALNCRWASGSFNNVVAAHRAAAAGKQTVFEQSGNIAGLANVALLGPLPTGDSRHTWTGAEFSAIDLSTTGTVDAEARAAFERQDGLIVKLNDAVGRNGQEIHEVRVGLGKLAPT